MDFDAIVIGSGFGGTVATTQLVGAGKKVLVIERGAWWVSPIGLSRPPVTPSGMTMRKWLETKRKDYLRAQGRPKKGAPAQLLAAAGPLPRALRFGRVDPHSLEPRRPLLVSTQPSSHTRTVEPFPSSFYRGLLPGEPCRPPRCVTSLTLMANAKERPLCRHEYSVCSP
jgi:hypothetical protein